MIRQFYATLEISIEEEKIWWTTEKRTYYATFAQFAAANQLDYEFLKDEQSANIVLETHLMKMTIPCSMSLHIWGLLESLEVHTVLGIILL